MTDDYLSFQLGEDTTPLTSQDEAESDDLSSPDSTPPVPYDQRLKIIEEIQETYDQLSAGMRREDPQIVKMWDDAWLASAREHYGADQIGSINDLHHIATRELSRSQKRTAAILDEIRRMDQAEAKRKYRACKKAELLSKATVEDV